MRSILFLLMVPLCLPAQPQSEEIQRLSIEDRQAMLDLLHITSLRVGPTSRPEPRSPQAHDEPAGPPPTISASQESMQAPVRPPAAARRDVPASRGSGTIAARRS